MTRNESKANFDHQTISQLENRQLLNHGGLEVMNDASDKRFLEICDILNQGDDRAANDAFDKSYSVICDLLNEIDWQAAADALEEDLSDISELRSRLRKESLQGLCWIIIGMCLILSSFAIVTF